MDLYKENDKYTGSQEILDGFKQHSEQLTEGKEDMNFDTLYHTLNKYEVIIITQIVKGSDIPNVTMNELLASLRLKTMPLNSAQQFM